jgi:hypothetical protein
MAHAPGSRPSAVFALAATALVFGLTFAAGCRKQPPAVQPAEDAAEREKKATLLYRKAAVAPIPEKYDLLRRLMAVYDDTAKGQDAYLELVALLVRDQPPQGQEALKVARTFRDRHAKDARVGECFLQIADTAYALKDEALRSAALADWSAHLEARDVAGDVPKAPLYVDFVRLRLRQERWTDADVAIDTALAQEDLRVEDRVELLVRKGNLHADRLGDVPGGRAAFQKALETAQKLKAAAPGQQRGIPIDQIEAEIKKLEGR